jgi:hypothetical protein
MATIKHVLFPQSFVPDTSAGARFKLTAGTNVPVASLAFDAATAQACYTTIRAVSYGSGNLTAKLQWYADTASAGDVIWGMAIACITADTDSQDIETKAFATEQTVTDSHLGTTGQRLHTCSITISNLDSIAADDRVDIKLRRVADDSSDTMTGDALLVSVEISYSDS